MSVVSAVATARSGDTDPSCVASVFVWGEACPAVLAEKLAGRLAVHALLTQQVTAALRSWATPLVALLLCPNPNSWADTNDQIRHRTFLPAQPGYSLIITVD